MDDIARFIEDRCEIDASAWVPSRKLFDSYAGWAQSNGEIPILTMKALTSRLKKKGFKDKKQQGQRGWFGLQVRPRSPAEQWQRQGSNPSSVPALPSGRTS